MRAHYRKSTAQTFFQSDSRQKVLHKDEEREGELCSREGEMKTAFCFGDLNDYVFEVKDHSSRKVDKEELHAP